VNTGDPGGMGDLARGDSWVWWVGQGSGVRVVGELDERSGSGPMRCW